MVKLTLKKQVIDTWKEHKDLDPMQLSEILKSKNVTVTAAYTDQIIRAYKEQTEKMGIDINKPSTLEFTKIDDKPERTREIADIKKELEKETENKETPKTIKAGIQEPTKQDIENLKTAPTTKPEILEAILSGKAKPIIKSLITVENYALKQLINYEHDEDTQKSLIDTWEPILDKYLSKIGTDSPIYIAIITTVILHIPVIIKLLEKYLPQITKKKEDKPNGQNKPA